VLLSLCLSGNDEEIMWVTLAIRVHIDQVTHVRRVECAPQVSPGWYDEHSALVVNLATGVAEGEGCSRGIDIGSEHQTLGLQL
jgi:hypothetical protein